MMPGPGQGDIGTGQVGELPAQCGRKTPGTHPGTKTPDPRWRTHRTPRENLEIVS